MFGLDIPDIRLYRIIQIHLSKIIPRKAVFMSRNWLRLLPGVLGLLVTSLVASKYSHTHSGFFYLDPGIAIKYLRVWMGRRLKFRTPVQKTAEDEEEVMFP